MFEETLKFYQNFPKEGINFVDIMPFMQDKEVFTKLIGEIGRHVTAPTVAAPEARAFLFCAPLLTSDSGVTNVVPFRKKGKLPRETIPAKYDLEYGTAEIEIHKDAIKPGQKVVVVDDLIATGGTTEAIVGLIEQLGGKVVKLCFVMELAGLKGRERLAGYDVESAITYEGK